MKKNTAAATERNVIRALIRPVVAAMMGVIRSAISACTSVRSASTMSGPTLVSRCHASVSALGRRALAKDEY